MIGSSAYAIPYSFNAAMKSIHPVTDKMLRAFDASARAGSFTAAASLLDVGQPAISHAVGRLERALGQVLFERGVHGIDLTAAGHQLFNSVSPALNELDAAVAAVRTQKSDVVTISVSTSLASYWLMPRLPSFKRRHPDIELRLITTDTDRTVGVDDADLWIPLGNVAGRDLVSTPFCEEEVVPVISPAAATGLNVDHPRQLLAAPLVHLEERYAPRFDWASWFAEVGVGVEHELPGNRSNDYSLILQAALDGQAVALGWRHVVADLLTANRLVEIGPTVRSDEPFPILSRKRSVLNPAAETLRDWLIEVAPIASREAD